MLKRITLLLSAIGMMLAQSANAGLNVFACEPEWASLAETLGGDLITVTSATTARQDPHHIEARPSLIAKLRRADLLVCSGAELEIGWLPMLQRKAGNRQVLTGQKGFFEAAMLVERLEVPEVLDRSMGDVHASGNPHVHLDPYRLLTIAMALSERMIELDPQNGALYEQQRDEFKQRWLKSIEAWEQAAAPLKDLRLVVHHKDWSYLFEWLKIVNAGALEPKPGLPATASHLASLKQELAMRPAAGIIHAYYQSPKAAKRFSQLSGIEVVELPYTVGGGAEVSDLFSLYDVTLERLLKLVQ
ncbi:MAG: zinc ABC transporter substrate-binding protein [Candidatus Thiodiazotropha sp. (ex Ctena orbiculata)]|nr:zinc ABC transporter substrate-binding protein [Candidatus Thiodiazotropha taylori]